MNAEEWLKSREKYSVSLGAYYCKLMDDYAEYRLTAEREAREEATLAWKNTNTAWKNVKQELAAAKVAINAHDSAWRNANEERNALKQELAAEREAHERVALSESGLVQLEIELRNKLQAAEQELAALRERERPWFITIQQSKTADTRSCDFSQVTKETLLESSVQHIADVVKGLEFFRFQLLKAGDIHDWDKLKDIDGFHRDFVTGFKQTTWWDNHRKVNRHHLLNDDGVPADRRESDRRARHDCRLRHGWDG